jgi:small conductance mechanosensitive channel
MQFDPTSIADQPAHSAAQMIMASDFWSDHAAVLITLPLQLLGVVAGAFVVRLVAHRAVDRLTTSTGDGRTPRILSPLKERAANSVLLEKAGLLSERRHQRASTIGSVLKNAISFLVFVTAFLLALSVIGVNLMPFVAGTSLIGVALGFGAQNIVKDFLAGIFMILEDQYGVGDVIDLKEATGTVEAVGLRTTKLRDVQGTVWYVRNGEIVRVGNQSQHFAQVVVDVPVRPGTNLDRAGDLIASAALAVYQEPGWQDLFLAEPEFLGIEAMSLEETVLRVVARVRPLEQWRVSRELRRRIRIALDPVGDLAGDPQAVTDPTSQDTAAEPAGKGR